MGDFYRKYSIVLGSNNNCIIIKFIEGGTDDVQCTEEFQCKQSKRTILDGNVTNMSLITHKKCVGIDADYTSFHGYFIIIFYSSPYNLKEELNIYG